MGFPAFLLASALWAASPGGPVLVPAAEAEDPVLKAMVARLARDPADVVAHLRLGLHRYRQGRHADAARHFEDARRFEGSEPLRNAIGTYIEAVRELAARRPARDRPVESVEDLYERGVQAYASDDLPLAEALFKRILELRPDHVAARKGLDRVRAEQAGK